MVRCGVDTISGQSKVRIYNCIYLMSTIYITVKTSNN